MKWLLYKRNQIEKSLFSQFRTDIGYFCFRMESSFSSMSDCGFLSKMDSWTVYFRNNIIKSELNDEWIDLNDDIWVRIIYIHEIPSEIHVNIFVLVV